MDPLRYALQAAQPNTKLLAEDRRLSLRLSKLTSLRETNSSDKTDQHKRLTGQIEEERAQRQRQ